MNKNPDGLKSVPASPEMVIEQVPESVMTDLRRCQFGVVISYSIGGKKIQFWVNANNGHLMKYDVLKNDTVDMGQWPHSAGNYTNPNI
jgi:hypothetical protein